MTADRVDGSGRDAGSPAIGARRRPARPRESLPPLDSALPAHAALAQAARLAADIAASGAGVRVALAVEQPARLGLAPPRRGCYPAGPSRRGRVAPSGGAAVQVPPLVPGRRRACTWTGPSRWSPSSPATTRRSPRACSTRASWARSCSASPSRSSAVPEARLPARARGEHRPRPPPGRVPDRLRPRAPAIARRRPSIDGEVVFSEEIPWDPARQADPQWHVDQIMDSLRRAAAHLPRVDAIGGSSAGAYVNNEVRAASLFRSVPPDGVRGARPGPVPRAAGAPGAASRSWS